MGVLNYTVNRLLERKDTFADFVNGTLFGGEEYIHAENLRVLSPNSGILVTDANGRKKALEQRGDVHMQADEVHFSVMILAEPQASVDYTMVVRMMEYTAMKYKKQVEDRNKEILASGEKLAGSEYISGIHRDDTLIPVIGIVFYCGIEDRWDGADRLYDMFGWNVSSEEMEVLRRYISDFKLNVVQVQDIEDIESFKSSLQVIFGMLKCGKDKKRLCEFMELHREELEQLDEVESEALMALLGQPKYVEKRWTAIKEGKEWSSVKI